MSCVLPNPRNWGQGPELSYRSEKGGGPGKSQPSVGHDVAGNSEASPAAKAECLGDLEGLPGEHGQVSMAR